MGCSPSKTVMLDQRGYDPNSRPKGQSIYPQRGMSSNYPPQQGSVGSMGSSQTPSRKPVISKSLLTRYVELEKLINKYESSRVGQKLLVQANHAKYLKEKLEAAKTQLKDLRKSAGDALKNQSAKDFAKQLLKLISDNDNQPLAEQEEVLETISAKELLENTIVNMEKQSEKLEKTVKEFRKDAVKLKELYVEQETLLASIFYGQYGSELENQMERDLDYNTRIYNTQLAVKQRWQSARLLIYHGCAQISVACTRWNTLMRLNSNGQDNLRYALATEARDNLNAAIINVANAQGYLSNIQFPYCSPQEMQTLRTAAAHIYNDMHIPERQNIAMSFYHTNYQRSYALLQWLDQIIDNQILKELEEVGKRRRELDRKLRIERVKLLQTKLREELGETMQIDLDIDGNMSDAETLKYELAGADDSSKIPVAMCGGESREKTLTEGGQTQLQRHMSGISETQASTPSSGDLHAAVQMDGTKNAEIEKNTSTEDVPSAPVPLSLKELAPPPSKNQLFGEVDAIQKEHKQQIDEYAKMQAADRSRLEQGLNERLAARRSRRDRVAELEA